jgi:hypothetical protein
MTISLSGWGTGALPTFGWGLGGFVEGLSFGIWPDISTDTEVFIPSIGAASIDPEMYAHLEPVAAMAAEGIVPSLGAVSVSLTIVTASGMERPSMNLVGIQPTTETPQLRISAETDTLLPNQKAKEGLRPSINTDMEEIG